MAGVARRPDARRALAGVGPAPDAGRGHLPVPLAGYDRRAAAGCCGSCSAASRSIVETFRFRGVGGAFAGARRGRGQRRRRLRLPGRWRGGAAEAEPLEGTVADAYRTHAHRFTVSCPATSTTSSSPRCSTCSTCTGRPTRSSRCAPSAGACASASACTSVSTLVGPSAGFSPSVARRGRGSGATAVLGNAPRRACRRVARTRADRWWSTRDEPRDRHGRRAWRPDAAPDAERLERLVRGSSTRARGAVHGDGDDELVCIRAVVVDKRRFRGTKRTGARAGSGPTRCRRRRCGDGGQDAGRSGRRPPAPRAEPQRAVARDSSRDTAVIDAGRSAC